MAKWQWEWSGRTAAGRSRLTRVAATTGDESAIAMPNAYIVPKGNPGGAAVMKFIATAQSVPAQLDLLACLGMTPTNPEAIAASQRPISPIPSHRQRTIPTSCSTTRFGGAKHRCSRERLSEAIS